MENLSRKILVCAHPLQNEPSMAELILNYLILNNNNLVSENDLKNFFKCYIILNNCAIISVDDFYGNNTVNSIEKILKWYQPIHINSEEIIGIDEVTCTFYEEKGYTIYNHRYFNAIELFVTKRDFNQNWVYNNINRLTIEKILNQKNITETVISYPNNIDDFEWNVDDFLFTDTN